jgi:hypothetical protein
VNLEETNDYLMETGKPMLPVQTKTYTYPKNTKIRDVTCRVNSIQEQKLEDKILPVSEPKARNKIELEIENIQVFDEDVYNSDACFPDSWYSYDIKCGIDGINVIVRFYPVRYSPANDMLYTVDGFDIKIISETFSESLSFIEERDLVIIAPSTFSSRLQPLVKHKNDIGVVTFLKKVEDIYDEYPDGRDRAEKIKLFIKDAVEDYNISYVLLVGGRIGQKKQWYVPVREANNNDVDLWEYGHVSDLYFSDIYRYNETSMTMEFDDWDSDGDGIFAEWYITEEPDDVMDFQPDVHVGRLACRYPNDVTTVVNKIIRYETWPHFKFWNNRMIGIAGDTFWNPDRYPGYEGEEIVDYTTYLMENAGYNVKKLYTSLGNLKRPLDVILAWNPGAAFVHLSGHSNPGEVVTHAPESKPWVYVLTVREMQFLINGNRLPIVVVGGCHTSQFNVTTWNFIDGLLREGLQYFLGEPPYNNGSFMLYDWIPECWSWKIVRIKQGGAIATIGNTGLGYDNLGSVLGGLSGYVESHFFYHASQKTYTTLGEIHSRTITDYTEDYHEEINTLDGMDSNRMHRKTIEQWALLGDPSLKIFYSE